MSRKIFVTMASGGHDTERHYNDTIRNLRKLDELRNFLGASDLKELSNYTHGRPYAVWGAVPGVSNNRTWNTIEQGDYVIVYQSKHIIAVAEVAMKTRNPKLAEYFWGREPDGSTWENIFFMTNLVETYVPQELLNLYLGYQPTYFFRGFGAIEQSKTDELFSQYGDLLSLMDKLKRGENLERIKLENQAFKRKVDLFAKEEVKRATTEHDEMQWRLISLGNKAKLDVWLPPADQGKEYDGHKFREHVIESFGEVLDIPTYIKNIDTVWKLGLSIKAAFEVENSTSIYSGILRLSDLRALAPNSNYPLFIVADRQKRSRVFDQLRRPTFSNAYLRLDEAVKYLSYDTIRDLDENLSIDNTYDISWIESASEVVPR